MSTTIIAPHDVDTTSEHYAGVAAYMAEHGAPEIRAWWSDGCGAWIAVEGSHRLAVAHASGVTPIVVDVGASDEERAAALRASDIDDGSLFGRRDDDDADLVAWWESYRRVADAPSYNFGRHPREITTMITTTTAPATFTITRRSRNLGIGSTSQPVRRRNAETVASWLEIESVDSPDVVGTLADVMSEYDRVRRVNSGHDHRVSFFVGGVKVRRDDFLRAAELLLTENGAAERRHGAGRYMSDAETVTAA